jgi:tetratricopeptide (TPR) repeat protein
MRSFFPLLATTLLLCASTASAQIGIIGNSNARECYQEAKANRANTGPCDDSLAGDMLVGRNLAATYVNRAVVRTNAGRLAAALKDLERAESIRPQFGEIYASRGNVFYYQSSFEAALAEHDRGIAVGMKKLYAAHYNRGLALEQLGRIDEAKAAYRQSIALVPGFDPAKARLLMF